jgi:hypothetical protein
VPVGGGTVMGWFFVERSGDISSSLTVACTVGGSATPGVDYEPLSGSVTFPAGVDRVEVPVRALDDYLFEGDETITLTLAVGPAQEVRPPATASMTLRDNEGQDRYEPNNSIDAARALGSVAREVQEYLSLHAAGDEDYFSFTTPRGGEVVVELSFEHELGDLGLELYNAQTGQLLRASHQSGDAERVSLTAPAAGTYVVRVMGEGAGVTHPDYRLTVEAVPVVKSAVFDPAGAGAVRFVFSRDVSASLDPDDLQVVDLASGVRLLARPSVAYDPATHIASFTYAAALPDGNYRATLVASGVADSAANTLAASATFDFFILAGDVNRDRTVNGTDFALLAGNFGRTGMTYAQGDLSGNGSVNGSDFAILAGNFGRTVPSPAAASRVFSAAGASQPPAPSQPWTSPARSPGAVLTRSGFGRRTRERAAARRLI